MALQAEHDLHRRRKSRNVGLGLVLAAFVVLVMALTVVKITRGEGNMLKGYDHQRVDPTYLPHEPAAAAPADAAPATEAGQ